jgi:hypothetical protein
MSGKRPALPPGRYSDEATEGRTPDCLDEAALKGQ